MYVEAKQASAGILKAETLECLLERLLECWNARTLEC